MTESVIYVVNMAFILISFCFHTFKCVSSGRVTLKSQSDSKSDHNNWPNFLWTAVTGETCAGKLIGISEAWGILCEMS